MSITSVDLGRWSLLQVLLNEWMHLMTHGFGVTSNWLVIIARKNLSDDDFHLHLAVEGPCHESLRGK